MIRKVFLFALAAVILVPFTSSCNKEKDTLAIITVLDTAGHPVAGAYVKLFANLAHQPQGAGSMDRLTREEMTDSRGHARFDYTQQYKQGQAGFARRGLPRLVPSP